MKLPSHVRAAITLLILSFLLPISCGAASKATLADAFANPPLSFKSQPLWHLNGTLTKSETEAQLQASRDQSGFGGVALLPVKETQPPYLTDEYFARYGEILDACKRLGLSAIFYDDIGYPSGTAGKRLAERFPDDRACRLDKLEVQVTGPTLCQQDLPGGIFMGAVAMNKTTLERRDISSSAKDSRLKWQAPEGSWTVMIFTCVRFGQSVDYLSPESVRKFISLTYEEYYQRFAPHFGTTIRMTFFDDINIRGAERRVWTPAFNENFQKKYGFSPVPYYPALWYDIGPQTEAARVALFGFRAELLSKGYPATIHEWTSTHGVQSSGHAMGQYHPQPSFLGGDHMLFYRESDIPMIDSIHYYGHGRPGFKLTTSAAACYDRPLTAVEIYGNYKFFDADMLYRSGMELFARGANLFLPHGMWYNPKNVRIKPLISHFDEKIGPALPRYNDWVARCSLLLQGGRHVADIGVLYPVAAMHAHAQLNALVDQPSIPGNVHAGMYLPPKTDLDELSDCLTGELRRDFTYLHPQILDSRCVIKDAKLHLNNATNYEDYAVLIVPSARVVHASNMKAVQLFYESGGKVIITTQLPSKSAEFDRDAEVTAAVRALFGDDLDQPLKAKPFYKRSNRSGGAAYFIPELNGLSLGAALDDALAVPDVRFAQIGPPMISTAPVQATGGKTGSPDVKVPGMLSYLHKVKDGREIYFLANSTDQPIDSSFTLRGNHRLEKWDPHTGRIETTQPESLVQGGQHVTRVPFNLPPRKSIFFLTQPNSR